VAKSKLRQFLLVHRNLELSCGEQGDVAADKADVAVNKPTLRHFPIVSLKGERWYSGFDHDL
jgi:hypothetical protein